MKLIHGDLGLELVLLENQITVLSVENPWAYSVLLRDIWIQVQGGEGGFILSECEKIKNIGKEIDCIFNPFSLDCNEKRISGKLYQELREQADIRLINESRQLNGNIVEYMDKVLELVPYALEYKVGFDILGLLKLYEVRVENVAESLLEKIVEYLRVMRQICGVEIFVFIGLKQYLLEEELTQLYEFVFYEKINLVIFEAMQFPCINGEKCWIFDKDMCIIEVE